jgi:hypothetical protein
LPRVSFILPVRNAAATLGEALQSLRAQTFPDFEVLVFDDGSDDGSLAIAQSAADADSRVRVVGSERVGLVAALGRLVECSDAALLGRMDADDRCHPERLARQLELLERRPELDLASCLIRCFPEEHVADGMRRYEAWLNQLVEPHAIARDMFVGSPLCHPSVLMRREAFERAGGYLDDAFPEDYHLWLRFLAQGSLMAKAPAVLFYWRERPDRLTRVDPRCAPERFADLKLRYLLSGPLAGRRRLSIWGAGPIGKGWGRRLAEAGIEVTAHVDVDQHKIGNTIGGQVPVIAAADLADGEIPGGFMLVAVGAPGARGRIRSFLCQLGAREQSDFLCVA